MIRYFDISIKLSDKLTLIYAKPQNKFWFFEFAYNNWVLTCRFNEDQNGKGQYIFYGFVYKGEFNYNVELGHYYCVKFKNIENCCRKSIKKIPSEKYELSPY